MHFDQRTQAALREVGLDTDALQTASALVAEAVDQTAALLGAFFDAHETIYSDMDMAHATTAYPEHAVEYCDVTTHADEMRGWIRFDTWGAYVEDGRILDREPGGGAAASATAEAPASPAGPTMDADPGEPVVVELSLGPSIHDRVRFAPTREALE